MVLDEIDRQILQELQKNARISNLDLADKVNLTPTPCARRVKQLEEAGIITQHVTLLDEQKLGLSLTAMVSVTLEQHNAESFEQFEMAIAELPEIIECYIVTGRDSDILMKVLVRDMQHYEQFLLRQLTQIAGVSGVRTSFVLRQTIRTFCLPL